MPVGWNVRVFNPEFIEPVPGQDEKIPPSTSLHKLHSMRSPLLPGCFNFTALQPSGVNRGIQGGFFFSLFLNISC